MAEDRTHRTREGDGLTAPMVKLCGLSRPEDVEAANRLGPDFIGFVFAKKSRRYVSPEKARDLKAMLRPGIRAVGVFVNKEPERVAALLREGIIDLAQLHGQEDERYLQRLREALTAGIEQEKAHSGHDAVPPVIQAFVVKTPEDLIRAEQSSAEYLLLDSGAGTGKALDWEILKEVQRPYFLAGGLNPENVQSAIELLHPFGVDVSSGIERDGMKDPARMEAFVRAVRAS